MTGNSFSGEGGLGITLIGREPPLAPLLGRFNTHFRARTCTLARRLIQDPALVLLPPFSAKGRGGLKDLWAENRWGKQKRRAGA